MPSTRRSVAPAPARSDPVRGGAHAPGTISEADRAVLGRWAADCAERALPIFEARAPDDPRPRAAIEGIRAFARGELRSGQVRSLATAAHSAARAVPDPAAAAAARAAGSAAAVAMIHRTATTPGAAEHAFGPAAYAALARERTAGASSGTAADDLAWAIRHASPDVRAVARRIPAGRSARGRMAALIGDIHEGLGGPSDG